MLKCNEYVCMLVVCKYRDVRTRILCKLGKKQKER